MRYTFYLSLLLALIWGGCEPTPDRRPGDGADDTSQPTDVVPTDPEADYIVGDDRFGHIKPGMTLVEIRDYYGEENIRKTDIPVGEGMTEPGAELYPDSRNTAAILVYPDGKVRRVSTTAPDGQWHTQGDVRVGTSLQVVEAANDAPFELAGFAWDYGGTTTDWKGGSMPERVQLRFRQTDDSRLPDALMGDRLIMSDDEAMRAHTFEVKEIFVQF